MLRTNILANLIGSGWIALLTLIAVPIQIYLLGVEAFGLIGLITVFQIIFGTLDLGLSASVTQTIASDRSPGRCESADLTNSVGSIYAVMAVVIGGLLWLSAGWIATRWLKPQLLDDETVLAAVRAISLYVAFRWPIAFYTGVLNGIQRMDILNLLKAGTATLRLTVGILLILAWPSIVLFLAWFAISAVIELLAFAIVTGRLNPALRFRPYFSMSAIRSVWRFSLTMAAIAILSMLITQLDRIVVSKLLSLGELGYYTLAYTTGIAISLLQTSINTASLPAFSESVALGGSEGLVRRYLKVSELMAYAIALPSFVLIFFGADILRVWVNAEAARETSLPLSLLTIGFFLNALVSNAYIASIATRNARIPAIVNAVAVLVYVPTLYFLTTHYGIVGAALAWGLLNAYYIFSLLPAVHHAVIQAPVGGWLWRCLAVPTLLATVVFTSLKSVSALFANGAAPWVALVVAIVVYVLGGLLVMSPGLRAELLNFRPLATILPFIRRSI